MSTPAGSFSSAPRKLICKHSAGSAGRSSGTNGGTAAAQVISADTGAKVYSLDMAMSGDSYFDIMYRNIDTIKEALG